MFRAIERNKRTTVLLIVGYGLVVIAVGLLASFGLNSPWPAIIIIGLATAWVSITLVRGVRLAEYLAHWTRVSRSDQRDLYVTVENLAIRTGMPTPMICISDEPDINAFAIGMSPKQAIVGITTGALEVLDSTELEAVMAHEMAHIRNYDTRVQLVITAIIGSMGFLAMFFWALVIAAGNSQQSKNDKERDNSAAILAIIAFVPAVVFTIVAWVIGPLVSAAVSRQREYLADASGVEMTRYPDGMISLLQKIEDQEKGLAVHSPTLAAFYYHNERGGLRQFFYSTHPPTHKRIKRVREIAESV